MNDWEGLMGGSGYNREIKNPGFNLQVENIDIDLNWNRVF
jgi:hypothetical protein